MSSDESTSKSTTRVWFDRGREHFYAIPEDAALPEGELRLHSLRGQVWRVQPEDVQAWEISRETAMARMGEHINAAWGEMRGAWSKLLDMGQKTADAAGVGRAGEGRPELPESLASLLGMEPSELLNDPSQLRSRIRRAVFGEEDAADPEAAPMTEPDAAEPDAAEPDAAEPDAADSDAAEPDTTAEAEDAAAAAEARLEELARKASQGMRDVLRSPEFGAAMAGFGAALRRAGQKLQQAAEDLEE